MYNLARQLISNKQGSVVRNIPKILVRKWTCQGNWKFWWYLLIFCAQINEKPCFPNLEFVCGQHHMNHVRKQNNSVLHEENLASFWKILHVIDRHDHKWQDVQAVNSNLLLINLKSDNQMHKATLGTEHWLSCFSLLKIYSLWTTVQLLWESSCHNVQKANTNPQA